MIGIVPLYLRLLNVFIVIPQTHRIILYTSILDFAVVIFLRSSQQLWFGSSFAC